MLGNEMATLVDDNLNPGKYNYNFDASALPSGIYFYKLETDNFNEVKKMTLNAGDVHANSKKNHQGIK